MKLKWWGYKHVNGSLHLKRYWSEAAVDDAYESSFVDDVLDPFEADSREEAARRLRSWAGVER